MKPVVSKRKVNLVVFDLDGTLVDSKSDISKSVNFMRQQLGLKPLLDNLIYSFTGDGVNMLVKRALDDAKTKIEVERGLTIFLDYYKEHLLDTTVTYPGAKEMLHELEGKVLAVYSNKRLDLSRIILRALGIEHCFAFVFGGDSFPEKKPSPMGLKFILDSKRIRPAEAIMVGDTEKDILTGRNAGVLTCGVTFGMGGDKIVASKPDFLIDDLRELLNFID